MMREELDEFSREVADLVFSRHPEWEVHARAVSGDDGSSYLHIALPGPPGSELSAICLTCDNEATEFVGDWHAHFDPEVSESWLEDSLTSLEDLLAERLCVASYWVGDAWRGSTCFKPGVPIDDRWFAGAHVRKIRSWNGTYDQDIDIEGAG